MSTDDGPTLARRAISITRERALPALRRCHTNLNALRERERLKDGEREGERLQCIKWCDLKCCCVDNKLLDCLYYYYKPYECINSHVSPAEFQDTRNLICQKCSSGCLGCTGLTSKDCLACNPEFFNQSDIK